VATDTDRPTATGTAMATWRIPRATSRSRPRRGLRRSSR